jgi:hypothetical protein
MFAADKINVKDLDVTKLSFSEVKTMNKSKFVEVFYAGRPLSVQLPKMPVHMWANDGTQPQNESQVAIDLLLRDSDSKQSIGAAWKKLTEMDERVCQEAAINSVAWGITKKAVSMDAIKVFQYEQVRVPDDPKYSPSIKAKLYKNKDETVSCKVFDKNKEEIRGFPVASLRGANVAVVAYCTGVWITAGRFKVSWRVTQMRVFDKDSKVERVVTDSDAVPLSSFDQSKLTFSAPFSMGGGGKIVYVNYNGKPFVFDTGKLYSPFPISVFNAEDTAKAKYSLTLSFKDAVGQACETVMSALDARIPKDALAAGWTKDTQAVYRPILRSNADYPADMSVNLPTDNGVAKFKMSDDNGNEFEFDPSMLHDFKGAKISAVIQCTGVWVNNLKYGVSFKAISLNVTPSCTSNVAMDDEDEEDDECCRDVKSVVIGEDDDEDV